MKLRDVLTHIELERSFQDHKWGVQDRPPLEWALILAEEFGEVAKEANEVHFRGKSPENYIEELIQTAAVCVAAIESYYRQAGK